MTKALRYLKPYWISVLAVVVLVFAQVQSELALPDYMSNIVTYGIQYSGITEPIPEVLSEETYSHLKYFISDDSVLNAYESQTLYEVGSIVYHSDEPVYVLTSELDEAQSSDLQKAFLTVSMMSSEEVLSAMNMEGQSLFTLIEAQPQLLETIQSQIDTQMAGYTEDNLRSASIMMVKSEYEKLGINVESLQNSYIVNTGIMMLLIALLSSIFSMLSSYLAARVSTGAARDMRNDVFEKVESFSSEEFSKFSTASLITRTTNDIQQVQQVLTMLLRIVLFAPFMGFTSLFKVLRYPSLASILGWTVALMLALMMFIFTFALPKFRISQKLVDRLNLVTREQLDGMLVIRAFNNEETEEKKFDKANSDITKLNIFLNRLMSVIQPIMTFMMSGVSVLIIWIGSNQIDLGTMQVGDMMAFLQYATHVLMSFMIVAAIFIMIPRSSVSARRIFEVLETDPSIKDPENPVAYPTDAQAVSFNHVSFRYPGAEQDVLTDINFTAKPGETIAFIGSTGSGKSTLVNLIPRFFDVTGGEIKIGDINIKDMNTSDLRDHIGYIPQKGFLFSGTIESNLKYADENATEETILKALEISQAKEFVEKNPEGIQKEIAQGGTNVSGGQKQRLSIARALTKNAQIYIFDDTFSALDYATDARLREALNKMIHESHSTLFIVAQRISTIMKADQIIVLDNGQIVGHGKHDELLKNCQVYQEIARSQLSQEELEK